MITEEMIEQLDKKLKDATEAAEAATRELNDALDAYAIQMCPHKVGDIIDCQGWSHKGKKMIVDSITRTKYRGRWTKEKWRVMGRILKKDGTIGSIQYGYEGE
jgi:hypothetical protein